MQSRPTLTRDEASNAKLSNILVLTSSVIDRFAIKYTLCNKMQLANQVQFVSSKAEASEALVSLNTTSEGLYGFACVVIDMQVKTSIIKKVIGDLYSTLETHGINYKPKILLLSAELAD